MADWIIQLVSVISIIAGISVAFIKVVSYKVKDLSAIVNEQKTWMLERMKEQDETIKVQIAENRKHLLRLEVLHAINRKASREIVSGIYDEYRACGGNSYVGVAAREYLDKANNRRKTTKI
jgi:hypothetical protein